MNMENVSKLWKLYKNQVTDYCMSLILIYINYVDNLKLIEDV